MNVLFRYSDEASSRLFPLLTPTELSWQSLVEAEEENALKAVGPPEITMYFLAALGLDQKLAKAGGTARCARLSSLQSLLICMSLTTCIQQTQRWLSCCSTCIDVHDECSCMGNCATVRSQIVAS